MDALAEIESRLEAQALTVLGGFSPQPGEAGFPRGTATLLMIGLREPGFWPQFTASPEWQDGQSDAMDRWSRRVLGQLACSLGAKALFPFGGPPYHPFYQWALRTGRVWDSPVRLLVHADQGLMVSFRGALALRQRLELPGGTRPCDSCPQPCLSACPAGALGAEGYDVPACHAALDLDTGADCLSAGCRTRRACPRSQSYARLPEQSAYHMRQFHP
ncbi:ferredoxin [Pseudogemmobacter faecipullorum]|uniref:Ferredoxin n=1 Tax=Pseudogemmobacter faecipullorum TaxID=2755041 RepID=A0ABS8CQB1_9RHOB|nr:ferredoxin [Pseudogemmobacter faecipullorum]MCB5411551.1 ferredoxin [Pseudogemmobacter faecipullorum]